MKVLELVESARSSNEAPFEGTPDKRSAKIVAAALRDLSRRLEETDDGKVVVAGFGSFVVRNRDQSGKRIVFRASRRRNEARKAQETPEA